MAQRTFKPGDRVRNINPTSAYYNKIKDKIGIYQRAWDERYNLNRSCDVRYPGVGDLYGREDIAQSEYDLEAVPALIPSTSKPFDWIVGGCLVRVHAVWKTCGHKYTKDAGYVRCKNCYPGENKVIRSHGPYYYSSMKQNGKWKYTYIGAVLPELPAGIQGIRKEAEHD
jgi:hypothetical protein